MVREPNHHRRSELTDAKDFAVDRQPNGAEETALPAPHFLPQAASRPQGPPPAASAPAGPPAVSLKAKEGSQPNVPGFEIVSVLHQGPMGTVYKARQADPGRFVALKTVRASSGLGRRGATEFLAAAEAIAPLQHPNIAPIFDYGQWEGGYYLATELLEGESLAGRLAGMPQSEREASELVETLARAVQFCHDRRIVHRHLSPANILFTSHDVPKITNFGMANDDAVQVQASQGTAAACYMAPEVASPKDGPAGPAADVYSLGAILYELLTGRPPLLAESPAETLRQVLEQKPTPPSQLRSKVSHDLETICLKCLEKEPSRRYGTADALAEDLRRFLQYRPVGANVESPVNQAARLAQQWPLAAAVAGVLVLGLVGGIVWISMQASSLATQKEAAVREKALAEARLREAQKKALDAEAAARLAEQNARQAALNSRFTRDNTQQATATIPAMIPAPTTGERAPNFLQPQTGPIVPPPVRDPQREAAERRMAYIAQIRLAKQAWDRGDTAQVRQLLEPYRVDQDKQAQRDFAWFYLWRAANSGAIQTLREHTQPVRQAAFMPDGAGVVTLGDDGALILWDAAKGKKLQAVSLDRDAPASPNGLAQVQLGRKAGGLHITDDGQWVAAYGKTIWLGNFQQPDQARRLADHETPITCLALSHDDKLLATGDERGEIVVRQLPNGQPVRQWKTAPPQALAFTRDAKLLLAGTYYGNLMAWDMTTGNLQSSDAFSQAITSVAISPDGKTVAVALADRDGVVRLWEPATRRVRAELRGHQDEVTQVAFSPEGDTLITASRDQTARLWNATGSPLKTFKGHLGDVDTAAFSPDGQRVVTGSMDKTAIVWQAYNNQEYEVLAGTPALGWIDSLTFTAGSDQLICSGCGEDAEGFLSLWNLAQSTAHPVPLQATIKVGTAMGFSPDGRLLAVGEQSTLEATSPSRIRIWSMESGRVAATLPNLTGRISAAIYSPDARLLATAQGDIDETIPAQIQLWEAATGAARPAMPKLYGRIDAAFTPDGKTLVTVASSKKRPGQIYLWNPATGEFLGQIENLAELQNVSAMALSPDGTSLVTGHADVVPGTTASGASLKLWDLTKKRLVAKFPPTHPAEITALVFSRRGKLVASADAAGNIRTWDITTRKLLPTQIAPQGLKINSLCFDWLGDRLATAGEEKRVRVWHIDTARELARLELTVGNANVIRFTPDGTTLVATTSAGGLIAWESETYRLRGLLQAEGYLAGQNGHAGEVTCASVTASGKRLITAGVDKTLRIWDMKTGQHQNVIFTAKQPISCLAMSPVAKKSVVGTGRAKPDFQPGEIVLCQSVAGESTPRAQVLAQDIAPTSMTFTPDGNSLAVCGVVSDPGSGLRQTLILLNLTTGKNNTVASNRPQSVAVASDGQRLAVGCAGGEIELWAVDSLGNVATKPVVLTGHRGPVLSLCFSPDNKTLVSGGYDKNTKVWDTATGEELLVFKHNGSVETLRFSPDGKILAAADRADPHGSVRLWRCDEAGTAVVPIAPGAAATPSAAATAPQAPVVPVAAHEPIPAGPAPQLAPPGNRPMPPNGVRPSGHARNPGQGHARN